MKIKLGKLLVKYFPAMVGSRNATLLLTKLNAGGLAVLMYRAAKDKNSYQWKKLAELWRKVGGNENVLMHAIKQGMRVEYKHHPNSHAEKSAVFNFDENYECLEPVTTGTAAATAAPLIVKIMALLSKIGLKPEDIQKVSKALAPYAKKGINEMLANKKNKKTTEADGTESVELEAANLPNVEKDIQNTSSYKSEGYKEKKDNSILLLAGVAVAVLLVFKMGK
jgi:hypothetical protein